MRVEMKPKKRTNVKTVLLKSQSYDFFQRILVTKCVVAWISEKMRIKLRMIKSFAY